MIKKWRKAVVLAQTMALLAVASARLKADSGIYNGKLLDTWTAATNAVGPLVAMGKVFVTGNTSPGKLFMIDPTAAAGPVIEVTGSALGNGSQGIAFDGRKVWTANTGGSVSIVTPTMTTPWTVSNVSTGFSSPIGVLFDGSNMWVTDPSVQNFQRLSPNAAR